MEIFSSSLQDRFTTTGTFGFSRFYKHVLYVYLVSLWYHRKWHEHYIGRIRRRRNNIGLDFKIDIDQSEMEYFTPLNCDKYMKGNLYENFFVYEISVFDVCLGVPHFILCKACCFTLFVQHLVAKLCALSIDTKRVILEYIDKNFLKTEIG